MLEDTRMAPSTRPYMGAVPYSDSLGSGVTFRVWAPFAQSVAVAGNVNGWSTTATPLYPEGNGNWFADVTAASTRSEYEFVLSTQGGQLWRMDPYARSVMRAAGGVLNGLVAPNTERYSTLSYSTPSWNELVIYEVHIRTFLYDPAGI